MKFSAPSWSAQPEGIQFGHSTSAVHHFHVEITTDSRVLTALHHPSCSRFEMNLQPGDTLPWKFPADVARRFFFLPTKNYSSPQTQTKKNWNIINNKKTTRSWFWGEQTFPTRTNVHSQFWRLFRNTNRWSSRTWLWIGRCCSPTRLDCRLRIFQNLEPGIHLGCF